MAVTSETVVKCDLCRRRAHVDSEYGIPSGWYRIAIERGGNHGTTTSVGTYDVCAKHQDVPLAAMAKEAFDDGE